jgi:dienelactone hydrolase
LHQLMQKKPPGKLGRFESRWREKNGLPAFFGGVFLSFPLLCAAFSIALLVISALVTPYLVWRLPSYEISINYPTPTPAGVTIAQSRATLAALATEVATLSQTTASPPLGTPTPPTSSVSPLLPIPVPLPLADYTIEGLMARTYPGGTLRLRSVMTVTNVFARYYIDYPSDGLTITGIMQVPQGDGPFPVVILNHGYIPRNSYWSGADTWNAAEYLNRRGYLTIAPDFRSWGESDVDNSFFSTGQVIDVLNLISSLSSLPGADSERVGMWGHSMGGGITTKAITIDPRIKAAVLYAPVSADDADVLARWGTGCKLGPAGQLADNCGGAEILVSDIDESLSEAYAQAVSNPELLYRTSPINYFDFVVTPVQIHVGTADTRTPPEWSASIRDALRDAGKEVEYFTYPGQGHVLEDEHWLLFMERVADFFDRHLISP